MKVIKGHSDTSKNLTRIMQTPQPATTFESFQETELRVIAEKTNLVGYTSNPKMDFLSLFGGSSSLFAATVFNEPGVGLGLLSTILVGNSVLSIFNVAVSMKPYKRYDNHGLLAMKEIEKLTGQDFTKATAKNRQISRFIKHTRTLKEDEHYEVPLNLLAGEKFSSYSLVFRRDAILLRTFAGKSKQPAISEKEWQSMFDSLTADESSR